MLYSCDVGNCDDTSATMAEKGFDGQKVFLLSARPKRSCYIAVGVENCDDMSATMAEKIKKILRTDERIAWPERQLILATTIIHIYRYFYALLSKGCSCMAKKDAFRSSTSRTFYSSMSSA